MPHDDTPDVDHDAVGVAVVNYRMPRLRTQAEVLANAHKIRQMIEGLKLGLPGLDLVIFPAYSTHGLLHEGGEAAHIARGTPGDETAVLARACRNARVWGVFSLTAMPPHPHPHTRPGQAPGSTLILMDTQGEIVQSHPAGGDAAPRVTLGPKGMSLMLLTGDGFGALHDGKDPRAGDASGTAELVVACPEDAGDVSAPRALALARHSYVAVANAAGFDGVRCHFGRSAVVGFDGRTLGECGEEDYGIQFVQLSKRLVREARGSAAEAVTTASCDPRSRPGARAPTVAPPQAPA